MYFLADYYNMTVHHFKLPHVPEGRDYMLEINPYMKNPSTEDRNNKIDARWIDTETGQFIDITSLRPNHTAREEGVEGALMCKDNHHYLETDIFPLRDTIFADTPCKVPYEYAAVLEEEYGKESLTKDVYEKFIFLPF
ncbi:MAG: hypothetical protein M1834_007660 [Cirrosporium novae-zelandiae]|nr:MAG: hypothetical protein M1834_007660 [Cirrosporium novae-zelandiae]